ncbi:hypothetical protein KAR91_18130 [Candidatus Pacearchaeota archaeon]|nr:hypothetical protein [Candidatus Pacearchaeota archaeon]
MAQVRRDDSEFITSLIRKEILQRVNKLLPKIIEDAKYKIQVELYNSVDSTVLSVVHCYDVERAGEHISITVKKDA